MLAASLRDMVYGYLVGLGMVVVLAILDTGMADSCIYTRRAGAEH